MLKLYLASEFPRLLLSCLQNSIQSDGFLIGLAIFDYCCGSQRNYSRQNPYFSILLKTVRKKNTHILCTIFHFGRFFSLIDRDDLNCRPVFVSFCNHLPQRIHPAQYYANLCVTVDFKGQYFEIFEYS